MLRRAICLLASLFFRCGFIFAQGAAASDSAGNEALLAGTGGNPAVQLGQVEQLFVALVSWIDGAVGGWGQKTVLGVAAWRVVALFVVLFTAFALAAAVRYLLQKHALRVAERTRWEIDDLVFERATDPASLLIQALGVYSGLMMLLAGNAVPIVTVLLGQVCFSVAAGAVIWYAYRTVDVVDVFLTRLAERTDNNLDDTCVVVARKTLRILVVAVGVTAVAKGILGWNLGAMLASAGIFGLAMAFAAQDTIANFFGTLMLLFDRPFRVGERIVLEDADGPVESVGFRSTRIRTLDGHLVSIPNKEVANAKIENVGRRPHIKRVSNLGITYDTPVEKVERALEIVRNILNDHRGMDSEFPPRVYFNEFNDCSLNIQMIAWYHPGEYWDYLEWCEEINLEIMRQFEQEGIEFAFPTTTTYLAHDPQRELTVRTRVQSGKPRRIS